MYAGLRLPLPLADANTHIEKEKEKNLAVASVKILVIFIHNVVIINDMNMLMDYNFALLLPIVLRGKNVIWRGMGQFSKKQTNNGFIMFIKNAGFQDMTCLVICVCMCVRALSLSSLFLETLSLNFRVKT